MASFDWYQATVRAPVDDLLAGLLELDDAAELRHSKGVHGYAHTTAIYGSDGRLGHVWHGGTHSHPHAVMTGEDAQAGAELLRARFPGHLVTRADAREDFSDGGAFDRIQPHLLDVARTHRVKVGTAGDHLLTMQGRTVYLGAKSSATQLRLYDKAAELRAKFAADPVRLAAVPETLTRLEAQVRPQTAEARARFATIEPLEVMGSSAWLRKLWQLVAGEGLQPVQVGKGYRQADDARAYAYLLAQYGGLLRRMCGDLGNWDCVGKQIGSDLAERERVARKR
jgi:hypothetical protein